MKQNQLFGIVIAICILFPAGAAAQNVGIGTTTPIAKLDVNGTALFRSNNTNIIPNSPFKAAVEFYFGRGLSGLKPTGLGEADLAFNWGGPGGGYRHFISTRHDINQDSRGNAIDFYINNSYSAYGSTAPDTGNIRMMSITANGVKIDTNYTLEFGQGMYGKENNAGKIGYQAFSPDALDIVGAGISGYVRKIKFWNEGGASFDGNVGIGTDNPHAPLQFSNEFLNRKIVLYEWNNNDHAYSGFGVNDGMLRYQVSGVGDSHVFFAATTDSTSRELMRITGQGKLGLGTSTPGSKGLTSSRFEIADENGSNSDMQMRVAGPGYAVINLIKSAGTLSNPLPVAPNQFSGIIQSGYFSDTSYTTSASINFKSGLTAGNGRASGKLIFSTTDTSVNRGANLFVMNELGNLGIGTGSPNAPLQFSNAVVNRKIVLWDLTNNDHNYLGFGINNGLLRYQVSAPGNSHVFFAGINDSTSVELMRITGTGRVGIGTSNPTAKLHVSGNQKIDSAYTIEFGAGFAKEPNAGKIGYAFLTSNTLDIIGGGTSEPTRKIKFWAEGGAEFQGNVNVIGSISVSGIQQETVQPVLLSNSWVNYGVGFADAGYWKDKEGMVQFQGLIKSGITTSGTLLFVLPAGYRPTGGRLIFTTDNTGIPGRVDVLPDGQVLLMTATSNAYLNLTGISFRSN